MFVTIKNKRAYLYSDKRTLLKSLGASGVVSADCTDDYALLVYDSGKAELRRTPSGVLLRALISNLNSPQGIRRFKKFPRMH